MAKERSAGVAVLDARTNEWKLEDAKNRFSEVVRRAADDHEPQWVTRNGVETAVVISADEYRRLAAPAQDLVTFMENSPLAKALAADGIDFVLERSPDDLPRVVDFGE